MASFVFNNVHIAALTCAVPAHIQAVNTDPENPNARYLRNFVKQMGIKQRHISITEQTCTDTGFAAAQKALEKTGWDVESLDGIIFMSQTPDYNPSTTNSHILHYRLGMRHDSFAFDMTLGCSGFSYGLSVCASYLQQLNINKVLFVNGDTVWNIHYSQDDLLSTESFNQGEGTTALLLEKKPSAPMNISLYSDGSGYKYLFTPTAGTRNAWRRYPKFVLPNGDIQEGYGSYMDGMEITNFATITIVECIKKYMLERELSFDTYDGLILHQPNAQIIKSMAKRLGIAMDKVPVSLDRYANTDSTTIPLTIADAYAQSNAQKLSLFTCGFGIGLSWGIATFEIDTSVIEPIFTLEGGCFEEGFIHPVE